MDDNTLLKVENLRTNFFLDEGVLKALEDVSFYINKGETLGIVGESGCGKSLTALSIMRLVQSPPGKIVSGKIYFEGVDLLQKSKCEMRKIRGNKIAMVFQEPMTSLNPVLTVGFQINETLRIHRGLSKQQAKEDNRNFENGRNAFTGAKIQRISSSIVRGNEAKSYDSHGSCLQSKFTHM